MSMVLDLRRIGYDTGHRNVQNGSGASHKVKPFDISTVTCPPLIRLAPSSIPGAGTGAWAIGPITVGRRYGPYLGTHEEATSSSSQNWQASPNPDQWMGYVNRARSNQEQNMVAFQLDGSVYYQVIRTVSPMKELLVWYDDNLATLLGLDVVNDVTRDDYGLLTCRRCLRPFIYKNCLLWHKLHDMDCTPTINSTFNCDGCGKELETLLDLRLHVMEHYTEMQLQKLCEAASSYAGMGPNMHLSLKDSGSLNLMYYNAINNAAKKNSLVAMRCTNIPSISNINNNNTSDNNTNSNNTNSNNTTNNNTNSNNTNSNNTTNNNTSDNNTNSNNTNNNITNNNNTNNNNTNNNNTNNNNKKNSSSMDNNGDNPNNNNNNTVAEKTKKIRTYTDTVYKKRNTNGPSVSNPVQCTECGKYFSTSWTLKEHVRTHTGDKPYSCNMCLKSFAHHSNMVRHYRIHTGERPFSCSYCGKRFAVHSNLTAHLPTHIGIRQFMCGKCRKSFVHASSLHKHMKIHGHTGVIKQISPYLKVVTRRMAQRPGLYNQYNKKHLVKLREGELYSSQNETVSAEYSEMVLPRIEHMTSIQPATPAVDQKVVPKKITVKEAERILGTLFSDIGIGDAFSQT